MRSFFNHLFYRVYWWNTEIVKENDIPIFSTILGVSAVHLFNILTTLFLILYYVILDIHFINKTVYVIISILIVLFNYLYFIRSNRYKIILKGHKNNISRKSIRNKDIGIIIYIVLSVVSFFWIITIGYYSNK